jgi:hypothetical protein
MNHARPGLFLPRLRCSATATPRTLAIGGRLIARSLVSRLAGPCQRFHRRLRVLATSCGSSPPLASGHGDAGAHWRSRSSCGPSNISRRSFIICCSSRVAHCGTVAARPDRAERGRTETATGQALAALHVLRLVLTMGNPKVMVFFLAPAMPTVIASARASRRRGTSRSSPQSASYLSSVYSRLTRLPALRCTAAVQQCACRAVAQSGTGNRDGRCSARRGDAVRRCRSVLN